MAQAWQWKLFNVATDVHVATWPVWLGLALALAGAAGGGLTVRRRVGAARARTANA
jgi:hypothetical protein